jgi:hypothetical protein
MVDFALPPEVPRVRVGIFRILFLPEAIAEDFGRACGVPDRHSRRNGESLAFVRDPNRGSERQCAPQWCGPRSWMDCLLAYVMPLSSS